MINDDYDLWVAGDPISRDFDNISALEAAVGADVRVVQDGVPMQVNLMTQEIMEMNIKLLHLK